MEGPAQLDIVQTHLSLKKSIMSFMDSFPFKCFSRITSKPDWSPLSACGRVHTGSEL